MIIFNINQKYLLISILVLFLTISIFTADYLTIESIENNKFIISEFINNNYFISVVLFFIFCVIFVNSPVPFAAVIKILGGFFFGFYLGALYNITATILACLVGFWVSRYSFKETFEKFYYQRLMKVENEIEKNGFYYFLTLRLIMVVPYFLINIIAGISRISFRKYVLSTIFGVIPASLVYANGGSKLQQINSSSELFRSETVFSLILVALISLIPVLIKKLNTS